MIETETDIDILKGLKAFQGGNFLAALSIFEKAYNIEPTPAYTSYLGLCLARERGQVKKGIQLCRDALDKEPGNTAHYLNLGKIYLITGNKQESLKVFREGLSHGQNQEIIELLNSIGTRTAPIISVLPRNHPINKYLGILLTKLRLK